MKQIFVVFLIFINLVNATTFEEAKLIQKTLGSKKSIPYYKELIKKNNSEAMHELALIYIKGKDIKRDIKKAHKLLIKSSKLKNTNSYYTLGKLHLSKKTNFHNKIKAYNYFVDAANSKHAKAQTMLGKFFLFGIVIDKDYEKSLYYFKKASKQKDYDANCYIAYMYASGSGVFPNFGRAHVFAKEQYKKGNKLCKKVWKDYNLGKYPEDKSWKIGNYTKPVK